MEEKTWMSEEDLSGGKAGFTGGIWDFDEHYRAGRKGDKECRAIERL